MHGDPPIPSITNINSIHDIIQTRSYGSREVQFPARRPFPHAEGQLRMRANVLRVRRASSAWGSTKFTLFETVTSLVPPTSRGPRSASLAAASTCTLNHPYLNTKINFAINKEVRARAREGYVCLFVPWPEEEVVVQQGCSSLEELGLFPCSRPTAKVHALISLVPRLKS